MASELLHCCICPKQPNFSDSSHLLTHISSKGHLSHLHKLQVRSHQELSAGQQVALYDQWYTEHNVAQLLSERMQQKERKQAKRQADNKRRRTHVKREPQVDVDPSLDYDYVQPVEQVSGLSPIDTGHYSSSVPASVYRDMFDTEHMSTQTTSSDSVHSQLEMSWCPKQELVDDALLPAGVPEHGSTPEAARLKGIIWPGMDMFDSADEETQRKRNQKKDVSVLQRMKAMSQLVEPMETVRSPGGTVKKTRHMDELECDSPVEGESPIAKPASKRKRRPLSTINPNAVPRRHRRPVKARKSTLNSSPIKATNSATITPLRGSGYHHKQSARQIDSVLTTTKTTPTTLREKSEFTIFEDEFDHNIRYHPEMLPNPFITRHVPHGRPTIPNLVSTGWPLPELRTSPYYDPFQIYRPQRVYTEIQNDTVPEKENVNPLVWQKEAKAILASPSHNPYGDFADLNVALGPLADVYAFIKNPLIGTSPELNRQSESPQNRRATKYESIDRITHNFR